MQLIGHSFIYGSGIQDKSFKISLSMFLRPPRLSQSQWLACFKLTVNPRSFFFFSSSVSSFCLAILHIGFIYLDCLTLALLDPSFSVSLKLLCNYLNSTFAFVRFSSMYWTTYPQFVLISSQTGSSPAQSFILDII